MIKKIVCLVNLGLLLLVAGCSTTQQPVAPRINNATELNPSNPEAANYNVQLGMGYLEQGDVQRAKHKLLQAMDQDAKSAPAQEAMGALMENTGETNHAEKYYQRAVELDPNSGSAHNNYGAFLCRMKRFKDADREFNLAVQDLAYLNTAETYENAGLCAMQVPDNAKATGYFQKAILQDARRANSYLALGQISFDQKNYSASQKYLDQYMQLVPDPGPEALWLGIRIARIQKDNITAGRYALNLQTKYASSKENQLLRASQLKKTDDQPGTILNTKPTF